MSEEGSNRRLFLDDLEAALSLDVAEREVVMEHDLVIRSSREEALQRTLFGIICNPYFGLY